MERYIKEEASAGLTLSNLGPTEGLLDDDVATWRLTCQSSNVGVWYERKYSPLGPRVTLTAFARTSTPVRMLARPSLENLISLWAPRLSTGFAAFAAERRTAEEDAEDRRCMVEAGTRAEPGDEQRKRRRRRRKRREKETRLDSQFLVTGCLCPLSAFPQNCLESRSHAVTPCERLLSVSVTVPSLLKL